MVTILTSVGIAGVVVSLVALGFGFAYNEFGTGNALIGAGASGLGASLLLIALSAALRELRRIAGALTGRTSARGQAAQEVANVGSARVAAVRARAASRSAGEEHAFEPRPDFGADLAPDGFEAAEAERPRPNVFAPPRPAAELAPMAEPIAPVRGPAAASPSTESSYEPKFGPADILARLGGRPPARSEAPRDLPRPSAAEAFDNAGERDSPRAEPPARAERAERANRGGFEAMWQGRQVRSAPAEAAARVARPETREEPKYEPRSEPAFEPKYEPKRAAVEPPPAAPTPPVEARSASILKSGVIDGMAYTLYTDGSIEAQLPQGTLRFASIEELRVHLERNG